MLMPCSIRSYGQRDRTTAAVKELMYPIMKRAGDRDVGDESLDAAKRRAMEDAKKAATRGLGCDRYDGQLRGMCIFDATLHRQLETKRNRSGGDVEFRDAVRAAVQWTDAFGGGSLRDIHSAYDAAANSIRPGSDDVKSIMKE
eukprot:GHVU01042867.1.p1 GENE.GHVU01042867.1~~GHVU01042867.1.p1  ORF type:complete len:143 (+),score=13.77 GHVU01042867.1:356-784(+)